MNKRMKKLTGILFGIAILMSFSGCGNVEYGFSYSGMIIDVETEDKLEVQMRADDADWDMEFDEDGTNTGVIADGYQSQEDMEKVLECITFEPIKTGQGNEHYYYEKVEEIDELLSEPNNSIALDFATDDELNVSIDSDENINLTYNEENDYLLRVYEDEELDVIIGFMDKDAIDSYCSSIEDGISNDEEIEVIESGQVNNVMYTLITYETSDGNTVYEMIGWVIGSNIGFLADGYESERQFMKTMESISFEIEDTKQRDEEYYFNVDIF